MQVTWCNHSKRVGVGIVYWILWCAPRPCVCEAPRQAAMLPRVRIGLLCILPKTENSPWADWTWKYRCMRFCASSPIFKSPTQPSGNSLPRLAIHTSLYCAFLIFILANFRTSIMSSRQSKRQHSKGKQVQEYRSSQVSQPENDQHVHEDQGNQAVEAYYPEDDQHVEESQDDQVTEAHKPVHHPPDWTIWDWDHDLERWYTRKEVALGKCLPSQFLRLCF